VKNSIIAASVTPFIGVFKPCATGATGVGSGLRILASSVRSWTEYRRSFLSSSSVRWLGGGGGGSGHCDGSGGGDAGGGGDEGGDSGFFFGSLGFFLLDLFFAPLAAFLLRALVLSSLSVPWLSSPSTRAGELALELRTREPVAPPSPASNSLVFFLLRADGVRVAGVDCTEGFFDSTTP
jgi:hypothetical protein